MKNVLFIVVDSVYEKILNENPDICPFINSVKDRSFYFSNVFSQGPYTEAGTKGLLCSENTLDNETYLFRYSKAQHFISGMFKDNGYKTSSIIYPTTLYNEKITQKLDGIYHSAVFLPGVFWSQKLLFYKEIWDERGLQEEEYARVYGLLDDILNYWQFSVDTQNHPENMRLFDQYNKLYPYQDFYSLLTAEKERYYADKKVYVDHLMETGGGILNSNTFDATNFIRTDTLNTVVRRKKRFCRKLVRRQLTIDFAKLKQLWNLCRCSGSVKNWMPYVKMWARELREAYDIWQVKKSKDFKLLLSAGAQLDFAAQLLSEETDEPQFVMVHVEEPHYYNSFFTYDSDDVERLSAEFDYANAYLESRKGKPYTGFLYYDLSVRYVDLQIQNAVEKLRKAGVLDNTTIVITSDHGSSYTGRSLRSNRVINFYEENYHVPFIIYDESIKGAQIHSLASNVDIVPTVMQFLGLKVPENLAGRDILSAPERPYVFVEYMGSGCPDIHLRPVWLAIRDEAYQINYIGSIFEEFSTNHIQSVYDLKSDPLQRKDIKHTKYTAELETLICHLRDRFERIKQEYV